jgi:hypothetical protein
VRSGALGSRVDQQRLTSTSDFKRLRRKRKVAGPLRRNSALGRRGVILAVLIAALLAGYLGLRDIRRNDAVTRAVKEAAHNPAT